MTAGEVTDRSVHPIRELARELKASGLPVEQRHLRSACHKARMPCRRLRNGRKWYASRVDARRYAENAVETNVLVRPDFVPNQLLGESYLQDLAAKRRRQRLEPDKAIKGG